MKTFTSISRQVRFSRICLTLTIPFISAIAGADSARETVSEAVELSNLIAQKERDLAIDLSGMSTAQREIALREWRVQRAEIQDRMMEAIEREKTSMPADEEAIMKRIAAAPEELRSTLARSATLRMERDQILRAHRHEDPDTVQAAMDKWRTDRRKEIQAISDAFEELADFTIVSEPPPPFTLHIPEDAPPELAAYLKASDALRRDWQARRALLGASEHGDLQRERQKWREDNADALSHVADLAWRAAVEASGGKP